MLCGVTGCWVVLIDFKIYQKNVILMKKVIDKTENIGEKYEKFGSKTR